MENYPWYWPTFSFPIQVHKDEITNATIYHAGVDSNIIHPVDYSNDIETPADVTCDDTE